MKHWQFALGVWVVTALGCALCLTGETMWAIPCVLIGLVGTYKLTTKDRT